MKTKVNERAQVAISCFMAGTNCRLVAAEMSNRFPFFPLPPLAKNGTRELWRTFSFHGKCMERIMRIAIVVMVSTTAIVLADPPSQSSKEKSEPTKVAVLKVQQGFVDAFGKGSKALAEYLEPVLAEEVVITDNSAKTYDKAQFLEAAKAAKEGARGPLPMEQKDVKAQVYGETAVVTGHISAKGLPQEAFRYTTVYVRREKAWLIVALQLTSSKRS